MALQQAGVQLVAQGSAQFGAQMQSATNAVQSFVSTTQHAGGSISAAGQVMIGALRQVGVLAVEAFAAAARAGADFLGDSITIAGDFEQTMNTLGAVSGATADELVAVAAKAKELGADLTLPATSAVDAGEAMLELSKAGFTVQEAMDAARGTLQLAAAAQIEEARAAEITSNAINAFGLEAKDAIFVSDLLAAASNASSIEIEDAAKSYQMAGAVFSNFQGPVVGSKEALIDLTTAIGILGNAGIKGSDAGTALKQSLLMLTGPSDKAKGLMQELAASIGVSGDIAYDATGKMRPFEEILELTAAATRDLTDEKRNQYITDIFGADASRAILILMQQGPDAWAKMTEAVTRQGAAQELAAAKTAGFAGALEGAKSQIETLQLTIGSLLLPVLTMLLNNYISPLIAAITTWVDRIASASDPILSLAAALHQWNAPLGSIAFYLVELARGGEGVNAWLAATPPLFQMLVGAIQGAVGAFQTADASASQLQSVLTAAWDAILAHTQMVWSTIGAYIPFIMQAISSIVQSVLAIVQGFWQQHGAEVMAFIQSTWNSISTIYNLALNVILTLVTVILESVAGYIQQHGDDITTILGGAWQIISNLISGALNLIQGILATALAVLRGDWQAAWEAIKLTLFTVVDNIIGAVQGLLEMVAGLMGTSMAEIGNTWRGAWDLLVQIVEKIPSRLAGVGQAIVNTIKSGFESAWNGFISAVQSKLAAFRDMLPFSEPKDHSSPLYGLARSGAAIIEMLQQGIDSAGELQIGAPTMASTHLQVGGTASPIASAAQIAARQATGTVNNYYGQVGNSYKMPVYTSHAPSVIGQSFAIAQAMSLG